MQSGNPVVVFGAGGHGKVVADAALSQGLDVLGFLDDDPKRASGAVLGALEVRGGLSWLEGHPAVWVALGIGDNATRRRLMDRLERLGARLATVTHRSAVISPTAHLGPGAVVLANAVVNPDARVGQGAIVNTGAIVEHDVQVGAFAHVSPNAALGGGASLGAGSHLGLGAQILPQCSVGEHSVVGAGAVVVRDLPRGVVAYGVPARVRREGT